jgi:hypothetical protein
MDLVEVGWDVVDWIGLAQERYRWRALVNAVMNLRVPYNCGKLPNGYTIGGLPSGTQLHRVGLLVRWLVAYTSVSTYIRIWINK